MKVLTFADSLRSPNESRADDFVSRCLITAISSVLHLGHPRSESELDCVLAFLRICFSLVPWAIVRNKECLFPIALTVPIIPILYPTF
jgi:hypothetical protein